ncbi:MAG TPA: hypothetical protein VFS08_04475 [Gemmatimonadaceae bacterium]|nr:hypothetical protein [Gemmatimonadaceae bacterium]
MSRPTTLRSRPRVARAARAAHRACLAAAAALAIMLVPAAPPLGAQSPAASPLLPDSGTRVRIDAAGRVRVVGTLVRRDSAAFVVRKDDGALLTVPTDVARALWVSRGRTDRTERALRGAGVGFLTGAVLAGAAVLVLADDLASDCDGCIMGAPVVGLGIAGVLVTTTAIGGVLGAAGAGERWQRVPWPPGARLGFAPGAGGGTVMVHLALPR